MTNPMTALALLALQPLAGPSAASPPIPEREEHRISAQCRGRTVTIRYVVQRPGPDLFSQIGVAGDELRQQDLARLNDMLGGYMVDDVSLYSCEGEGAAYELKFHVHFSKREERHIYLFGAKQGRLRHIR